MIYWESTNGVRTIEIDTEKNPELTDCVNNRMELTVLESYQKLLGILIEGIDECGSLENITNDYLFIGLANSALPLLNCLQPSVIDNLADNGGDKIDSKILEIVLLYIAFLHYKIQKKQSLLEVPSIVEYAGIYYIDSICLCEEKITEGFGRIAPLELFLVPVSSDISETLIKDGRRYHSRSLIFFLAEYTLDQRPSYAREPEKAAVVKMAAESKDSRFKTYLMKSGNAYKIGKAYDPKARLASFVTGNPSISLIAICEKDIETELHRRYKQYRVNGEWFNLSKADVEQIIYEFNNLN